MYNLLGCRCYCGVSCHGALCNCRPEYQYFLCHPEPQYPYTQPDYDGAAGFPPCGTGCGGGTNWSLAKRLGRSQPCGARNGASSIGGDLTGFEARTKYFTRIPKKCCDSGDTCGSRCLGDILLDRFEQSKQKELRRK